MSQTRSYKTYNKEFKEEAVSLITEQGYSVAQASKSSYVTYFKRLNSL